MGTENVICVTEQAESNLKRNEIEYKNSQMAYVIDEYVHSERDRQILKRRYIDGICIDPLSDEFGLTPRQISKIILKHEAVLFRHLLE